MGGVDELPDRVRRRLDEIFGDVLPSTTADERDDREGGDRDRSDRDRGGSDADLLANRPPHHDRPS